ncbi:ribonuclease kappa [Drosophila busckii]|uniref:ribonuclease kappa n=1 Tax=Drosophila busckii TaxID=30019 RepID=UPI00083ED73B|nr:ribonuclease kappa [Drosophila busckii]
MGKKLRCPCGKKCTMFCAFISIWGVIQCLLMGVFCSIRALSFLHDIAIQEEYEELHEFKKDADKQFDRTALTCYAAAAVYAVLAIICIVCYRIRYKPKSEIRELRKSSMMVSPNVKPQKPKQRTSKRNTRK